MNQEIIPDNNLPVYQGIFSCYASPTSQNIPTTCEF